MPPKRIKCRSTPRKGAGGPAAERSPASPLAGLGERKMKIKKNIKFYVRNVFPLIYVSFKSMVYFLSVL